MTRFQHRRIIDSATLFGWRSSNPALQTSTITTAKDHPHHSHEIHHVVDIAAALSLNCRRLSLWRRCPRPFRKRIELRTMGGRQE